MKKIIAFTLAMVMSLSMLAGCGKDDKQANKDWDGKLTIGIPDSALVTDYETNAYTLWLEEQTGIDIEFHVFAASSADAKSQLATMVAGGEKLPDMIIGLGLGDSEIKDYGDDRYFLDLKDYLYDKEKSANFWTLFEEMYPNEEDQQVQLSRITDPENGAIYAFPSMEMSMIDTIDSMVYINKTWLDKLGLAMPNSNESLREVLDAFVNKDPNGNGKKDEIGIAGRPYGVTGHSAISWLLNNFCLVNNNQWFNVNEKGKLSLPFASDEYRQALIYLNELTKDNLLTKSIWNMTPSDTSKLMNPADGVNTVGIFVGHPSSVLQEGYMNHSEYVSLPYWGYAMENEQTLSKVVYITEDCDNVDAAWDLIMAMNTKEAGYRTRYGEYGVDWDYADEGTKSFLGLDAEIKVLNPSQWATINNSNWHKTFGTILTHSENEVTQMPDETDEWATNKYRLLRECYDNFQTALEAKPYAKMIDLIYTEEEKVAIEAERTNCQSWINTMTAQFVCGTDGHDPADDADWQSYLDELERLGVDAWLKQAQQVYDRQTK